LTEEVDAFPQQETKHVMSTGDVLQHGNPWHTYPSDSMRPVLKESHLEAPMFFHSPVCCSQLRIGELSSKSMATCNAAEPSRKIVEWRFGGEGGGG